MARKARPSLEVQSLEAGKRSALLGELMDSFHAFGEEEFLHYEIRRKLAELEAGGVQRADVDMRKAMERLGRVRLNRLRRDFRTGRLEALEDAISYCHLCSLPPPKWLAEATRQLVAQAITPGYVRRIRGDRLHWRRWCLVTGMQDRIKSEFHDCSVEQAVAAASEAAKDSGIGGSESAFQKSYNIVQAALELGEEARFHFYGRPRRNNE